MKQRIKIGLMIRSLSNQLDCQFERHISSNLPDGITGLQGRVIDFVCEQKREVFQKDIEEEYGIQRSTATGLLKLMEKNGLLVRESVAYDARLKRIVLTKKALKIHIQIKEEIDYIENSLTENLTEEEIECFLIVIDKLASKTK